MSTPAPVLRSYGRIRGRSLKPRQARLLETLLPKLAVPQAPFDPRALMASASEVWLEAGFGAGEHLAWQAARRPDRLFIGAEVFVNGVATCLARIETLGLANVRLHAGDVRPLMARLPAASLDGLVVLFPDPWPKKRHEKRRLVGPDFIAEAARLLKPAASVRLATDWAGYADWMLQSFAAAPDFRWTAQRASDWRQPPPDHLVTRYEAKRLGDCAPIWLEFERLETRA
ncbi:MAG TPA: tRNA (guanosine(46)-N7)-methyltransferase TrmB [Caulobacteraceae bacterium]|nr:tRNA (guanosine(46)-N7)-methyltransferase TrmB [Caulobacteraceae bacterium]